jgi:hypothetical protein
MSEREFWKSTPRKLHMLIRAQESFSEENPVDAEWLMRDI